MPDRPASLRMPAPEPDPLEARLDALGRRLVEDESRRAQPPRAYLDAAAGRALTVRLRFWTPRLALAAAVLIAGIAAFILSRPAPLPPPLAPGRLATAPDAASPTVANLNSANRSVTSPEQLQLLTSGQAPSTPGPASPPSPYRASDTRSPSRIDAVLGEK